MAVPFMRPTIKDIAEKTGVGLGTVSRVLNDSPRVSKGTRDKVLSAIAELNYVPSPAARGLSLGKTLTLAVIVPFFTRSAFVERLHGVENTTADSKYDLVIYNVESAEKRDRYFRTVPDRRRVDGMIIISLSPSEADRRHLGKSGVPTVFLDVNGAPSLGFDRILIDDVEGGRLATEHLISLGHTHIGFLGDVPQEGFNHTSSSDRHAGYCRALTAAGLPIVEAYRTDGVFGRHIARELSSRMLSQPDRPTAIFASNDTQAMGVLEAARDLGLRVPEDLSVVGYDDIEMAEYLGLTTVHQPLFESGKLSVDTLLQRIEDPSRQPVTSTLAVELIVRRTTAPPR
ncbi:LacI family DNA-binding transcriptional regulator [Oryzibacter oryziterrae]|uniref:LacI family DNA-binding transcriptional regulator n=1 Tax=Oryzibacter oryziterrae TaxID=2766474 RepID=UPI001F2EE5A6|nr:LacI family DNA-binding transcriptional regulator [Oryzibacter oryziterrae]